MRFFVVSVTPAQVGLLRRCAAAGAAAWAPIGHVTREWCWELEREGALELRYWGGFTISDLGRRLLAAGAEMPVWHVER